MKSDLAAKSTACLLCIHTRSLTHFDCVMCEKRPIYTKRDPEKRPTSLDTHQKLDATNVLCLCDASKQTYVYEIKPRKKIFCLLCIHSRSPTRCDRVMFQKNLIYVERDPNKRLPSLQMHQTPDATNALCLCDVSKETYVYEK